MSLLIIIFEGNKKEHNVKILMIKNIQKYIYKLFP